MTDDMLRADPLLRRQTLVALALAAILAVVTVLLFHDWLSGIAAIPGTDLLLLRLRRLIGIGMTGSALCLAVLAWYSAHKAAKVKVFQQWPLPGVRVLRDTPVRRGPAARSIGHWLNAAAAVLMLLAVATGLVSWRLLSLS